MAFTVSNKERTVMGNKAVVLCTLTGDSSYPTGGEDVAAADFQMTSIDFIVLAGQDIGGGDQVVWDRPNSKLLVYTADGVEAANASDQTATIVEAMVIGSS